MLLKSRSGGVQFAHLQQRTVSTMLQQLVPKHCSFADGVLYCHSTTDAMSAVPPALAAANYYSDSHLERLDTSMLDTMYHGT